MNRDRPRLFLGWSVTLTAALGLFLSSAPIIVFSFSVFLEPLRREFHTDRAAISLAYTLYGVTSAISALAIGRLVDHYGARRIVIPSIAIFAALLSANRPFSGQLWRLYLFYFLLGAVSTGTGPMAYSDVVSHWFDRRRGLALGVMMIGVGTGAMIMPSLAQRLIATFGWRAAYAFYGGAMLLISVPVVGIFLKERPERAGLVPDGDRFPSGAVAYHGEAQGLSWSEVRHDRTFWCMLAAFCLVAAGVQGCVVHISAMVADRGSTVQIAALASSFLGAALLIGRVASGYLLDRFFGPRVAAFFFGGAAAGIALLGMGGPRWTAFAAAVLLGLGLGAEVDIIAYLTSRYFGLRSFAEIYSYAWAGFVVTQSLGPYLMGLGFEKTGSYVLSLTAFFFAALVAMVLMTRLGPYRYAPRVAVSVVARTQPEITA